MLLITSVPQSYFSILIRVHANTAPASALQQDKLRHASSPLLPCPEHKLLQITGTTASTKFLLLLRYTCNGKRQISSSPNFHAEAVQQVVWSVGDSFRACDFLGVTTASKFQPGKDWRRLCVCRKKSDKNLSHEKNLFTRFHYTKNKPLLNKVKQQSTRSCAAGQ